MIGSLALLAFVLELEWLPALLALQLALGLTLGRRWCLPCVLYFEVVQPRLGEGRLEDSRPPRFANAVGLAFLSAATVAFLAGAAAVGWALTLVVAVLALLAAATGLCVGCEAYLWLARLRALRRRVVPADLGLGEGPGVRVVGFSTPFCLPCREWEQALERAGVRYTKVDVSKRPELARRFGVTVTPLVLAVRVPEGEVLASFDHEPKDGHLARLRALASP